MSTAALLESDTGARPKAQRRAFAIGITEIGVHARTLLRGRAHGLPQVLWPDIEPQSKSFVCESKPIAEDTLLAMKPVTRRLPPQAYFVESKW